MSFLWLDLRAAPIAGDDGKVERIVWTSHDITDRKRLEQELRDSRLFIERVADALPQMLFVYDLVEDRAGIVAMIASADSSVSYLLKVGSAPKVDADDDVLLDSTTRIGSARGAQMANPCPSCGSVKTQALPSAHNDDPDSPQFAPPEMRDAISRWRGFWWGVLFVGVPTLGLFIPVLLWITLREQKKVVANARWNETEWPLQYEEWEKAWYCHDCEKEFTPAGLAQP